MQPRTQIPESAFSFYSRNYVSTAAGVGLLVALLRGFAFLGPCPHRPRPAWPASLLRVGSPTGAPGEMVSLCLHTLHMSLGVCVCIGLQAICGSVGTLQTHPFIRACVYPSTHAMIHSFTHSAIHPFIQPSIHPTIHLSTDPSIHPSNS